jgi:hypothetical protein
VATSPSDFGDMLASFFCSNYFFVQPVGMSKEYGGFLSWTGDTRTWMVTDGARMPIADSTELSALGGTAASVRATGSKFTPQRVRPRDGAYFKERSSDPVFVFAGGAPFLIPDPMWMDLAHLGGFGQVRVVPDNTIAAFTGLPDEGTLLREWSDPRVWRMTSGVRRWVTTPEELGKWGGFPSVRVVPDGALAAIAMGQPLTTYEVAFQANTGNLWTVGADNVGDRRLGMMPGTSPSIAALPWGDYVVAFQANTGNLWTVDFVRASDWKLGMMAGTSPSIAALPGGDYVVAFQANTSNLWTVGADNVGDRGLGMMAGTSPSIVALPGGDYEVAFQANTGNLWTVGADDVGDWQLGMMTGTSPSIGR